MTSRRTFAPVAKFTSIRALLAIAAQSNLVVEQADVDSAFPQAELPSDKVVYLSLPDGMRHRPEFAGKSLPAKEGPLWSQTGWAGVEHSSA